MDYKTQRLFSKQELDTIKKMDANGFSVIEIGAWLGRRPSSVASTSLIQRRNGIRRVDAKRWKAMWGSLPKPSGGISEWPVLEEVGDWSSKEWRQ